MHLSREPFRPVSRRPAAGFTLLEMLTTVASLVIVLGLMVSLARYVRNRSAGEITRKLMAQLESSLTQHSNHGHLLAIVPPLLAGEHPADEAAVQKAALANNRAWVAALRPRLDVSKLWGGIGADGTIRDGWGTPVVFMASGAANIRPAPRSERFFMSAGPDRQFLTLADNRYSYDP